MSPTMAQGDLGTGFETAIRTHERELVSFAFRLVHREDAARDCVQDAYLKAHAALASGAAPESIRPWLYRLVYHAAVDRLRRNAVEERHRVSSRSPRTSAAPGPVEAPEELVASLGPPHRAILILKYAYAFSYTEMESILGI